MKSPTPSIRHASILVVFAGLAAGCVGTTRSQSGIRHVARPFASADYVQVYVTGSHIPILVPKDPSIRRIPGISPVIELRPDDIQSLVSPTPWPMH